MLQVAGTDGTEILNSLPRSDSLEIYDLSLTSSTMPRTCEDPPTGTLLATFSLSHPWAGPAASGDNSMPLNGTPITSTIITTTGMPAYFRFTVTVSGDEFPICKMQGTMGRTGTLDSNGNPWDMGTDGQRWTQGNTANLNSTFFIALNHD
jgi:hypothetical protein